VGTKNISFLAFWRIISLCQLRFAFRISFAHHITSCHIRWSQTRYLDIAVLCAETYEIRNTLSDSSPVCQWPGPVARAASSVARSSRLCWKGLFETDEHSSVLKSGVFTAVRVWAIFLATFQRNPPPLYIRPCNNGYL